MPIIDVQYRLRELGRIRLGSTEEYERNGQMKKRPVKLERFRLTSASKPLVEACAEAYGGEVEPWEDQWEVVVEADSLPVALPPMPPDQVVSQWYELWSGGGCQRRCDGRTETLQMRPCLCPEDPQERSEAASKGDACKPTTRLRVILPEIPGVGVWRLETHGYYATGELPGVVHLMSATLESGRSVPARLRLEQRERKVPGQPTKRFAVPVLDADVPLGQMLETQRALTAGERPEAPPSLPRGVQRVPLEGDAPPAPNGDEATFDLERHARMMEQVEVLLEQLDGKGDADAAKAYADQGVAEAEATIRKLEKALQESAA